MKASIAVIIPAYDAQAYVGEAIESVLTQTLAPSEVLVVDDGSSDGTAAIVRSFEPRVRYLRQHNQGVVAARNRGIAESTADLVAFLDADDVWLPTKLDKQVSVFIGDPECVAVGCGLHITDAQLRVLRSESGEQSTYEGVLLMRGDGGITSGSRVLVTRRALLTVGGYSAHLSTSADWDLALRLYALGKVRTIAEPLVLYRQHGGNMHRGIALMERDMKRAVAAALEARRPSRRLRRLAWARLYEVLGGSYWVSGQRFDSVRCAVGAFGHSPVGAARYFGGRLLRRHSGRAEHQLQR